MKSRSRPTKTAKRHKFLFVGKNRNKRESLAACLFGAFFPSSCRRIAAHQYFFISREKVLLFRLMRDKIDFTYSVAHSPINPRGFIGLTSDGQASRTALLSQLLFITFP
ncbi:MAG: hypothetical protein LBJ67_16180 [Planctomycetaceae bacterium]|jgi:hypothetical protein|nr:hypothetical protein [Planctomycetaceae bacterium]